MIIIFTLNTLNHLFVVESPLIALLADSNFMGILDDNFLGDIFADSGASGNVSMEKGKVFLGGE